MLVAMKYAGSLALLAGCFVAVGAQQTVQVPWRTPADNRIRQNVTAYGSNVQRLELSSLSSDEFTVAGHQSFPSHQVRVKRVKDFCDPTVKCVF